MVRVRLAPNGFRPEEELSSFMAECPGKGAVVSFVGMVRPATRDGEAVTGLFLDHYPGLAEASLVNIANDAEDRFPGTSTRVVHRCGMVQAGEPIVFAAASADHRRDAFQAADYLMDRLKTEAAFWKREDTATGSRWIEPTAGDHHDRSRWD